MRALEELRTGTGAVPAAARRSVRVTLAACLAFYGLLYGLDRPAGATYALFAAVALAGLSRIPGTGRQRAVVIVRVLPVTCVLVVIGTFLAVRTWTAVAGMLVIGFCLAFAAAGGPRPAGAAPGLQLMYILPSFPPYAPDDLGERLVGTLVGLLLLVLAEWYVLPDPRVPGYRDRAADAADEAARCATDLERPPHTLPAAEAGRSKAVAETLRPSLVPEAERPAGPGVRERALAHTGLAARTLLARLRNLPAPVAGAPARMPGLRVVRAVRESAEGTAVLLREQSPPPTDSVPLWRLRAELADTPISEPGSGPRHAALLEVADAALVLRTAAELAVHGRAAVREGDPADRFWYARQSTARLWWHRIAGHSGPRSVHFQNAVRLAVALAVARTVAGVDSLPHGFWAMLAVVSLTRTTAVATRGTVRTALIGTSLGALAAGTVLALAGEATTVYEVMLPPLMLVTFIVGPVKGVGWAQAMFTLVVAMVFAQLSPVTWQLAEVRFLDVLIGSVIGIVCGVLAWPRGAHDELQRAVAELLRTAADDVEVTTRDTGAPPGPEDMRVRHALTMAETAFAQYQTERQRPAAPHQDWQAALMVGHHVLWGSRRVLDSPDGLPLGPVEAAGVREYGTWVAAGLREAADRAGAPRPASAPPERALRRPEPATAAPVFFAAMAWLDNLTADLALLDTDPSSRIAAAR
ncbi:FUSC family protein [Streptomyces sp. CA-243310]|uniref:FUSC family protein n=1 Tax=Streptomyces sp. CA-243310 TaxID=3240056 RepID=UPI003D8D74E1